MKTKYKLNLDEPAPKGKKDLNAKKQMKSLLYVTTTLPSPGFGSSVLIYRHLKRLKGWRITIITFSDDALKKHRLPESWKIIKIPEKKKAWPGLYYGVPPSIYLRLYLLRKECKKYFKGNKPDIILNQFGKNSALAYSLSNSWNVPLSLILHDPYMVWAKTELDKHINKRGQTKIIRRASKVLSVSKELNMLYNLKKSKKAKIIRPIPEGNSLGFAEWKDSFSKRPVVGFCGNLRTDYAPHFKAISRCLEKLDGRLIILSYHNQKLLDMLKGCRNIEFAGPFDNKKVIRVLREKASCIIVPGSISKSLKNYDKTSFPSKLTESVHLGLPVIIIASGKTALTQWAKQNKWMGYMDSLDKTKVSKVLRKMTLKKHWLRMAEQSRKAALSEFNAENIHKKFESELRGR